MSFPLKRTGRGLKNPCIFQEMNQEPVAHKRLRAHQEVGKEPQPKTGPPWPLARRRPDRALRLDGAAVAVLRSPVASLMVVMGGLPCWTPPATFSVTASPAGGARANCIPDPRPCSPLDGSVGYSGLFDGTLDGCAGGMLCRIHFATLSVTASCSVLAALRPTASLTPL